MPSFCLFTALTALLGASAAVADIQPYGDINAFSKAVEKAEPRGFPSQTFRSADVKAPIFQVNSWDKEGVDDMPYIFIGTVYGSMHAGPMILDARDLSLVYADQQYDNTYFSDVQTIDGVPYLTFWEGIHTRGHANGHCLVFDQNYNLVYNVSAQGLHGALADMHEMSFTPDGTIIFSTYFNIPFDCRRVGGPEDALLMDSGFQEIDPKTNEVVFEWAASHHFDVAKTNAEYGEHYGVHPNSGFDFFHINSIQKTVGGNYLISSRHYSMLALISGDDGNPIWILGGSENQFTDLSDGKATNFGWQHDARFMRDENHITMFDNHGIKSNICGPDKEQACHTRGLQLEIDVEAMTVRVVQEYFHPEHLNSGAMGGFQALESGNVMVSWGYNPGFVEYTSDGTAVMDVQRGVLGSGFVSDMFAYRVSKHDWVGRPTWDPEIAVDSPQKSTQGATVHVSWNGATEVSSWVVMASHNATEIDRASNVIASSPRMGFETLIQITEDVDLQYLAVAAVDASGTVLGSTAIVHMLTGNRVFGTSNITSIEGFKPQSAKTQWTGGVAALRNSLDGGFGGVVLLGVLAFASAGVFYLITRLVLQSCCQGKEGAQRGKYTRLEMGQA